MGASNFSFVHIYTQGILTGVYGIFQKFCSLKKLQNTIST